MPLSIQTSKKEAQLLYDNHTDCLRNGSEVCWVYAFEIKTTGGSLLSSSPLLLSHGPIV